MTNKRFSITVIPVANEHNDNPNFPYAVPLQPPPPPPPPIPVQRAGGLDSLGFLGEDLRTYAEKFMDFFNGVSPLDPFKHPNLRPNNPPPPLPPLNNPHSGLHENIPGTPQFDPDYKPGSWLLDEDGSSRPLPPSAMEEDMDDDDDGVEESKGPDYPFDRAPVDDGDEEFIPEDVTEELFGTRRRRRLVKRPGRALPGFAVVKHLGKRVRGEDSPPLVKRQAYEPIAGQKRGMYDPPLAKRQAYEGHAGKRTIGEVDWKQVAENKRLFKERYPGHTNAWITGEPYLGPMNSMEEGDEDLLDELNLAAKHHDTDVPADPRAADETFLGDLDRLYDQGKISWEKYYVLYFAIKGVAPLYYATRGYPLSNLRKK